MKKIKIHKFLFYATFLMPCFVVYAQDTVYIDEYIYDTIQVIDTVYHYDTIYLNPDIIVNDSNFNNSSSTDSIIQETHDTIDQIEIDSNLNSSFNDSVPPVISPIPIPKSYNWLNNFSLGLNSSLFYPNLRQNSVIKNDYTKASYSLGASILYNHNKSEIELGFGYSKYILNNNYGIQYNTYDTTILSNITLINTTYSYDTLGYTSVITYDSVYSTFDSTWHYFIDTAIYELYIDTVAINNYDTTYSNSVTTNQIDSIINTYSEYSYFEIPLIYRFSIYNGEQFQLKMGLGLRSGFLYKSTLNYYANNNFNLISYSREEFRSIMLSLQASAMLSYNINNKISLNLEPYYCFALNPLLKTNNEIMNSDRWGLNFSLVYSLGIKTKD